VDAAVLSKDGIVIKWDFKPGSVERSIWLSADFQAIKPELIFFINMTSLFIVL
jgi:hypothetical protein